MYIGPGWDIGTYQWQARVLQQYQWVVFMNARTHFHKEGWLARLVAAITDNFHPNALYGLSASYERCPIRTKEKINPHIRTAAFCTNPKTFSRYPYRVDTRDKGFLFESGRWNFSVWYADMGYPVWFVTWDGIWGKADWRNPPNIFRRGTQKNLLVWDRHTKAYNEASPEMRLHMEMNADSGYSVGTRWSHLQSTIPQELKSHEIR